MDYKEQAPGTPDGYQGQKYGDKDTEKLPRIQRKVFELLRKGGRYSVADISTILHLSDPRGHIAALRRKGFAISDEWVTTEYGGRFKRYFVG